MSGTRYIDGQTLDEAREAHRQGVPLATLAGKLRCDTDYLATLLEIPAGRPVASAGLAAMTQTEADELYQAIHALHCVATPVHRIAAAVSLPVRVVERAIRDGRLDLQSTQPGLFHGQPQRDALSER